MSASEFSIARNNSFSNIFVTSDSSMVTEPTCNETRESKKHDASIVSHIASNYGDQETSDILLVVGSLKFPAHRIILSQSPVFRTMLYGSNWRESTAKEVELNEVTDYISSFEDFLKYLYGRSLRINWQNVEALVYFGDKYAVDLLLDECLDFFYQDVEVSGDLLSALNGWKMVSRILGKRQDCMNVLRSVLFSNIELIMKNENIIASMDEDDMTAFISSNDIVCRTEFTLFKLLETWLLMKSNDSTRMTLLSKFSLLLRLPYMHVQEMSYVENSPKRLFPDENSDHFRLATCTIKTLLCDAYKYHVIPRIDRQQLMTTPSYRHYLDGAACMKYRLLNTDGLSSWSKMDSLFKVRNTMSQADGSSREFSFCVTLMRKINVNRQLQAPKSTEKQRQSVLTVEVSQNFCGFMPFKYGIVYIHERRAGSILRRPLTRFDVADTRMKSDIKLDNVNFEDVILKNSLYQYDDEMGNPVYLALDIFLLE